MDIIFSASIITAFFAGVVALFAPCCITVLLPAYLASAFREKKHVLKMTFIFFAGIAVILVPIGLGAAGLARVFRDFHREMYLIGGFLMIALAGMAVAGKGLALIPMPKRMAPSADATHPKSVFLLGVFSGAATSCCAPVLAGALTLAAISGAFWKALVVVFAYVFGMTFPLFIAAYFYDRFKIENSRFIQGKLLEWKIGGRTFLVHSTNLAAGAVFLVMGATLIGLALSGNAFWAPSFQAEIGMVANRWSNALFNALSGVPELMGGAIIIGIFFFFLYRMRKNSAKQDHSEEHHE
ncbi:MAG: cytochrome c biogenesis protein CcdA [Candidatus Niyogibacteria bacterium]|nr:cytochrome c biogenesis protein CcdA [Candidatus Niyogibacteria bacterium]